MMKFLHSRLFLSFTFFVAISFSSMAQVTIEEYYQPATGKTGSELKTALHLIIKDHTELPYTSSDYDVWDALKETDEDPNNTDNVLLIYTGRSEVKTHQDDGSGDPDSWNREHIWAKSHGDFGTDRGAGTDIHHLRPCDRSVNTSRSNLFFDDGGNPHSEATECNYDDDSWEPRDAVKGDIARMILYMAIRYDGEDGEPDLKMTNDMSYSKDNYTAPYFGKLSTLLIWNSQDPVDVSEKTRNEKVYTIQGNRNPFIDHPEWVDEVWTTVVDTESPEVSELTPANETTNISLTANCIIKFNEDVAEGTGSVIIKKYDDDTVFETLTIPTARLNYSSNQLQINPEAKFEEGAKYYVIIDNGVITDASSNAFEGISDKTIWNFTTTFTPPAITEVTPADNSVNVPINTELEITFDKNIQDGNGNISIQTNGDVFMSILASTTIIDGDMVTIQLPKELESGTEYSVLIDENAFISANGVAFEGITSNEYWNFSTEVITGIDDSIAEGAASFYPNPTKNEIRLTNMDNIEYIRITNLTGRNIMEIKSPGTRISLTNLPAGMYLVTFISNDGSRVTKKLLKQ